jgi:hypothetical protein
MAYVQAVLRFWKDYSNRSFLFELIPSDWILIPTINEFDRRGLLLVKTRDPVDLDLSIYPLTLIRLIKTFKKCIHLSFD